MKRTAYRPQSAGSMAGLYLISGILHILLIAGYPRLAPTDSPSSPGPIRVQLETKWTGESHPRKPGASAARPSPSTPKPLSSQRAGGMAKKPVPSRERERRTKPPQSYIRQPGEAHTSFSPKMVQRTKPAKLPEGEKGPSAVWRPKIPHLRSRFTAVRPRLSPMVKAVSPSLPSPSSLQEQALPVPRPKTRPAKDSRPRRSFAPTGQKLNERISIIVNRIQKTKRYPARARRLGLEGTVTVAFRIEKNGHLGTFKVQKSSGHASLDRATLEAIRRAAPFPFVPQLLVLPIHYRLTEDE